MLELKNISFNVHSESREKEILKNISLTVPDGKLYVITGPNGGGKSTLAKIIAGIEKPTQGQIIFHGEDITATSVTERAKLGIGFAFQQPVKFKGLRVSDLISLATGKKLSIAEICDYLSLVGLCAKEYIDREVNASLSGGELKRIEIATVLARKSLLTVFDEPEAGIDLWSFSNLIDVFQQQRKAMEDRSIMIISHQERILNIADEIIILKNGRIEKQGERQSIFPELINTPSSIKGCRGTMKGADC